MTDQDIMASTILDLVSRRGEGTYWDFKLKHRYCVSLKFGRPGDRWRLPFLLETRPPGRVLGETDWLQF